MELICGDKKGTTLCDYLDTLPDDKMYGIMKSKNKLHITDDEAITFKGKKDDLSAMLVCAVRYALGRRTYIVDWTCEFISNNQHLLIEKDKQVMIRDIKEQEKYGYGDECDKNDWLRLLAILEGGNDNE